MKSLVIFYSFEGNTKLMAENIAQTAEADVLELKPKKEIQSKGFMKYFWGGKAAMMKEKPELLPFDKNIQDYDLIFIGTPVWAWTYSPPLNSFFSSYFPDLFSTPRNDFTLVDNSRSDESSSLVRSFK